MHKSNFFIFQIKNIFFPFTFCLFILLLLVFSKVTLISSKYGLVLWANSVVPSLLPFFIATELLSHTFVVTFLGKALNPIMRPIFNVPGEGSFALIMGIISGYPIGAKIVCDLFKKGLCTTCEAERLIAFTNNSGPLFIIGSIGISIFGDTRTGILLLITHVLASFTVGYIFRFWEKDKAKKSFQPKLKYCYSHFRTQNSNIHLSNLGEILGNAIMNSIHTILLIGGFIVLFSVIISMLNQIHIFSILGGILNPILRILRIDANFYTGFFTGLFEITSGIKVISSINEKAISQNIVITSFLLGFGGMCVLLQVLSIISKVGLSAKTYIIGKLLQGSFAAIYTYLFLNCSSFFNLNL